MADWTSIARPYAKAIFMYALESKALPAWSTWLSMLQTVLLSSDLLAFIENPETTVEQHKTVLFEVMSDVMRAASESTSELSDVQKSLIVVLAENRRLPTVPAIFEQFETLRANEEHRMSVQVESFSALTDREKARLVERLTARFNRAVSLEVSVNPDLLGGAIISANGWVINASVKGQLDKLGADLIASSRG